MPPSAAADPGAERLRRAGVTERETEVLAAIGERLRNREIADRLHLSVRTVESHAAALLRKLGAADRAELVELAAGLRRTAATAAALPVPLTSLVGRDEETDRLIALVRDHRLVTLVGPGGVGKTRLALRVADAVGSTGSERSPDGARLADLAPVGPELVDETVARALGVVAEPGWSLREVLREVAGGLRGALLVVDNCEHVVAEAAEVIADLLTAGAGLRVLATSREPLGVPGEVSFPVRPLGVPVAGESDRAGAVSEHAAVRLFVDRARTADPGFVLTDDVAPAVGALCRRLDGLPLALELAASRVRSFTPAELLGHLDQRFELLGGVPRTVLPRHRTLRAAIDWSYALLDPDEQRLFDRLGVFPADFDFAAAAAVGDAGPGGADVLSVLPRLVDKSLVAAVGRGPTRYRLLESLRVYAAERGAEQAAPARERHAAHYLDLAEQAAGQVRGPDQREWLDRLQAEQPNLRAALAHAVAAADVLTGWRWVAALNGFWDSTGQRREAEEWIERVGSLGDPPAVAEVVAGLAAASELRHASDARAAFELADRAAALSAGLDGLSRARAVRALGMGAMWVRPELTLPALRESLELLGADQPWERALTMQCLAQTVEDRTEALDWGRRAAESFRAVGDRAAAANALYVLAMTAGYAGSDGDRAHEWLSESRQLALAAGSDRDLAHADVGFAQLAWLRADREAAARLMAEALPALRRLGDRRCSARALLVLGQHALDRGELADAERQLTACVRAIGRAGQSFVLVSALVALAGVGAAQGDPRRAAMLLGAAGRHRPGAVGAVLLPTEEPEELVRELVEELGAVQVEVARRDGAELALDELLRPGGVPWPAAGAASAPG